ncbi:uncharacterized protein K444DRAFT_607834, partial [Hyaloscypha bicolor E]
LPTTSPLARFSQGAQFAFDLATNPISSDELAAPFPQPNSATRDLIVKAITITPSHDQ